MAYANKELGTIYRREYKRRLYATKEGRAKVLAINKACPSYKKNLKRAVINWRDRIDNLDDLYIVHLLTRHKNLTREIVYNNPEIIEIQRIKTLIERKLKNK